MSTDAVTTIIDALNEHDEQPRKQIAEIVEVLGADASLALLAETKKVQDTGGIEVRDGTRRRTDGGVFFSLAKAKLPKADRNRIFRVKVVKPEGENGAAEAPPPPVVVAAPPRAPAASVPRRDERQRELAFPQRQVVATPQKAVDAGGRRRVVEVEVLRHSPKPVPLAPESARSSPSNARPAPSPASEPPPPARPVRRIVQVAAPPKEEPLPATPEAARDRVRTLLRELAKGEQRKVLLDLLEEVGGLPRPEPKREPKAPPPPPPRLRRPRLLRLDATGKERVLAAVTEALGLSASDLAKVLYGEESAGTRAKARSVIEKYRRSR